MEKTRVRNLLREYKKGDNSALGKLMQGTYKDLFRLAYSYLKDKMLAEDVVSETYIKVIEKIHTIKNEQNLNGYLRTITINKSLDILRKRKKELIVDSEEAAEQTEQSAANADTQYVRFILSKLGCIEREVLLLWQYGYTLSEISVKTDHTINQVRLVLDKAKKSFSETYHKNI